jgi:hypothetical protein
MKSEKRSLSFTSPVPPAQDINPEKLRLSKNPPPAQGK